MARSESGMTGVSRGAASGAIMASNRRKKQNRAKASAKQAEARRRRTGDDG